MKLSPARQVILALLALALLGLQAQLWLGEGSLRHVASLEKRVADREAKNERLRERNDLLAADVADLKSGLDTVEEIARKDLGMIREGETFFLVVEQEDEHESAP